MCPEVESDGEAALDGRQPLHEVIRNARQQEIVTGGTRRGAVAPPHQQRAVEDVVIGGHSPLSYRACLPSG